MSTDGLVFWHPLKSVIDLQLSLNWREADKNRF